MNNLLYATGNNTKFGTAKRMCKEYGVHLEQVSLDIPEIQARDKAQKVFNELKRPIVISDDSWHIAGLRGFPGPFMKFMNEWFTADDWMHIIEPLADRRIVLRQVVVYQDEHTQQLFYVDVEGVLLAKPRGEISYTLMSLVSFDGGKTSAAEAIAEVGSALAHAKRRTSWHDLCEWLARKDPENKQT